MDSLIVIDVETTGIDPSVNSILSIGALDFSNQTNQFYGECRIREGAAFNERSLEVNGFTINQINDSRKKTLKELLCNFIEWSGKIEEVTLAGHNVQFDIGFLSKSFALYGLKWTFGYRNVDTHALVYSHMLSAGFKMPIERNRTAINSNMVFKYCGLLDEPNPHNALTGAKMAAESLSRLIYGKPLFAEFSVFPVPTYLAKGP